MKLEITRYQYFIARFIPDGEIIVYNSENNTQKGIRYEIINNLLKETSRFKWKFSTDTLSYTNKFHYQSDYGYYIYKYTDQDKLYEDIEFLQSLPRYVEAIKKLPNIHTLILDLE